MRQWDTKDHCCHCRDINPGDTNNNDDERLTTSHSHLSSALYLSEYPLALTICHKELTPGTCWPSDGQSTTESCQSQDICCMCHLYAALSDLQQCVKLVRLYAALRTHTEMDREGSPLPSQLSPGPSVLISESFIHWIALVSVYSYQTRAWLSPHLSTSFVIVFI